MDYFDGNTVTALWNYAQHFSMSDNSYGTVTGSSTPGALNLISGQTHGASPEIVDTVFQGTDISDADPTGDIASSAPTFAMSGKNVGDLLNAKGLTWGWFEGGFKIRTQRTSALTALQRRIIFLTISLSNITLPPQTRLINRPHQSLRSGTRTRQITNMISVISGRHWMPTLVPAVSYLKAPAYQDGHAGYSSPVFEQPFLVDTIDRLMKSPYWEHIAIIITPMTIQMAGTITQCLPM